MMACCPFEYMDDWEKCNEISLPEKQVYESHLNMEDITDAGCMHLERVCEYHDLCVQSDTWLLADVFNYFRNMCLEIYGLDPAHFLSAPGLAWQADLKKSKVKLDLFNDTDMLLIAEKGIRD